MTKEKPSRTCGGPAELVAEAWFSLSVMAIPNVIEDLTWLKNV